MRRLLIAVVLGACASRIAAGAGLVATGGEQVQGSSESDAPFFGAGVFFARPLSRFVEARAEIFPVQLYREPERDRRDGGSRRSTVLASAACLLARYRFRDGGRSRFFAEGGAGPFYAYSRPVPVGGTRGNFFDQVGVGYGRGRVDFLLRFTHVSNANIGPQRHRGNPGVSFATAGIAWSFP